MIFRRGSCLQSNYYMEMISDFPTHMYTTYLYLGFIYNVNF